MEIKADLSGNLKTQCRLFILGQRTIQMGFLADLLRVNLRHYDIVLDDAIGGECLYQDDMKRLVLIDYSVVSKEVLVSFLDGITEKHKQIFVAVLNVKRDSPHDELIDWPEVRGIFYNDTTEVSLVKGVKAILNDEYWFARDLLARYLQKQRAMTQQGTADLMQIPLTVKELQILSYLVAGHSNKEIANRLDISGGTVKTHIYNIFRKLQVKNRVQAVNWYQNCSRQATQLAS